MTTAADRWDPLAGFELVPRRGEMVFRVSDELLQAGGQAVEQAVEAGFPPGTELEYDGGTWVVVLPYDEDAEPSPAAEPDVVIDLPPAPGYEWAEHDGQPVLRLRDGVGGDRPVLRPPRSQSGWRWRPDGDRGWILEPPPGVAAAATRAPAATAPPPPPAQLPAVPDRGASPRLLPPPPVPPVPEALPVPPIAEALPVPPVVEAPPAPEAPPARRRRLRIADVAGIALILAGIGLAAVLLFRGGSDAPPALESVAAAIGVPSDRLQGAITEHDAGEVLTGPLGVDDPAARIAGSGLVLIEMDAEETVATAAGVTGTVVPGEHLVVLLQLAGADPAPGSEYRYSFLDASSTSVAPGLDGALVPFTLHRRVVFDEAAGTVTSLGPGNAALPVGPAFAVREGEFVAIGVPREAVTGTTMFGGVVAMREGTPAADSLSPPYLVD